MRRFFLLALLVNALCGRAAQAEVVSSSKTHFTLRHEATSPLTPAALWQRLIDPASWWHPEHTYSGDAANLSLDAQPGGQWREDWEGGAVSHGRVVLVLLNKKLRMEAPFGPLQQLGAYTIWDISLAAIDDGTKVVFEEVSTGPTTADMAELAKAVDRVKSEAIKRLVAND